MNYGSATVRIGGASAGSGSRRAFARHVIEMVLVMFLGMGVLGGLAAVAFELAGSSVTDQSGGFRVMLMGFNMTIPMVFWMRFRGHDAARNAEMAAAMIVPTALARRLRGAAPSRPARPWASSMRSWFRRCSA